MSQRTRRRTPRFPNHGFVSVRHFHLWPGGPGKAARILKHWHRIAQLDPGQRITAEIGRWEGFRFISTPWASAE